jgi:hypothetical protein
MDSNVLQYSVSAKSDEQIFCGKDSHLFSNSFQILYIPGNA